MEQDFNDKNLDNLENNENELNDLLRSKEAKNLESIFSDNKNSNINKRLVLKKLTPFKKILYFLLILLVISSLSFIAGILVFGGFFKGKNPTTITTKQINLNIENPDGISSNGKLNYVISFINTEEFNIKKAELLVRFPNEFTFLSSTMEPSSISDKYAKWEFNDVKQNEKKEIKIEGFVLGKLDSDAVLSADMTYYFDKITSQFNTTSSHRLKISKSLFDVALEKPERIEQGKEFEYKLKIKNNSDRPIKNIKILLTHPEYFKILETDEKPSIEYENEQLVWVFDLNKLQDNLDSNADQYEKIITLKAVIDTQIIKDVDLKIVAGVVEDLSAPESFRLISDAEDIIKLTGSGFVFNISQNKEIIDINNFKTIVLSSDKQLSFDFGFKKENDNDRFKDVRIVLDFLGDDILSDKVASKFTPKVTKDIQNNMTNLIIEYNKSNFSSLKEIGTVEEKISLSLNLNKIDPNLLRTSVLASNLKLTVYGTTKNSIDEVILFSNPVLKLVLDSNFVVAPKLSYYFGPATPKVGSQTKYAVGFDLSNEFNNLSNITISTVLPNYVDFTGDYSVDVGEDVVYDGATRKVTWKIGELKPSSKFKGVFYVYFNPKSDQVGKSVDLTSKINITYKDNTLGKEFTKELNSLVTTNKVVK